MNRRSSGWMSWLVMGAVLGWTGCGSEGDSASNGVGGSGVGGSGGTGGGATGGTGGGATGGTGGSHTGGTGGGVEVCDGLDNDGDGTADEGCPCTDGETQECYLLPVEPPEGCKKGSQTCQGEAWGPCSGLTLPAPGEQTCCAELGTNPTYEVYDAFLAAYPAASMPKTVDAVQAFLPQAGSYKMKWSLVKPGQEFVDLEDHGGVIPANVEAGRAFAREQAEKSLPVGATVKASKEDPVIIEKLTGNAPCDGVGWGWGSLLYQMPDFSVGEMVYLYIGYCAGIPDADTEAFFYSEEPVVVCAAPIVK